MNNTEYLFQTFQCRCCGYEYDEEDGDPLHDIQPRTRWIDIQNEFTCPVCRADKNQFSLKAYS